MFTLLNKHHYTRKKEVKRSHIDETFYFWNLEFRKGTSN